MLVAELTPQREHMYARSSELPLIATAAGPESPLSISPPSSFCRSYFMVYRLHLVLDFSNPLSKMYFENVHTGVYDFSLF